MFPAHRHGPRRYFDPTQARYVRITIARSTAGAGGQIVEFEVYGNKEETKTYPW